MKTVSFKQKSKLGMTLIEILLVIALIALVASTLGRRVFSGFSRGKIQTTKIQMKQLEGDLDRYRLDCNRYPTTDQGLKALIEKSEVPPDCKNYDPAGYLASGKKLPTDAWGNPFAYQCDDGINYVIKSLGADGVEGGEGENADLASNDE